MLAFRPALLLAVLSSVLATAASAAPPDRDCLATCRAELEACLETCHGRDCKPCREAWRACRTEARSDVDGDGIGDRCDSGEVFLIVGLDGMGSNIAGTQVGVAFDAEHLSTSCPSATCVVADCDVTPTPPMAPVFSCAVNDVVMGEVRVAAVKDPFDPTFDAPTPSIYEIRFEWAGRVPTLDDFEVFDCVVSDDFGMELEGLVCTLDLQLP